MALLWTNANGAAADEEDKASVVRLYKVVHGKRTQLATVEGLKVPVGEWHILTASQVDAARLHGGEKEVLKLSARVSVPVAILAALLGGILSLSDPGGPLIMGDPLSG